MTRDEANLVINRVMDSADRVPNYEEDLKAILEVFEDGSDENDTMVENVGMMACGSKKAFKSDFLKFGVNGYDDDFENDTDIEFERLTLKGPCGRFEEKFKSLLDKNTQWLWMIIAPFLKGMVLYTPSTEFTDALISEVRQKKSLVSEL